MTIKNTALSVQIVVTKEIRMKKTISDNSAPFKHLIVGVDFSVYSKTVLKQARQLASQFDCDLIIAHAAVINWDPSGSGINMPQPDLDELRASLARFYQTNNENINNIEVHRGSPTDVLIKVAKKYKDPLIVVGSQGRGAVSRFILGSHAENIALHSPFPVWVHRGHKIVPFKKILVPTDLSKSSRLAINKLKKWPKANEYLMKYLYVKPVIYPILNSTQYRESQKSMQSKVKKSIQNFQKDERSIRLTTLSGADPSVKISQVGKKYDVIAMNPHHKSGLFKRFGKITSKVIRISDKPVLVIPT